MTRHRIAARPISRTISVTPLRAAEQRAAAATLHPAAARMGRLGARPGPILALAAKLAAKSSGRADTTTLYCRGLAALIAAREDAPDQEIIALARRLMLAVIRDPAAEAPSARAIESNTDRILRRARGERC